MHTKSQNNSCYLDLKWKLRAGFSNPGCGYSNNYFKKDFSLIRYWKMVAIIFPRQNFGLTAREGITFASKTSWNPADGFLRVWDSPTWWFLVKFNIKQLWPLLGPQLLLRFLANTASAKDWCILEATKEHPMDKTGETGRNKAPLCSHYYLQPSSLHVDCLETAQIKLPGWKLTQKALEAVGTAARLLGLLCFLVWYSGCPHRDGGGMKDERSHHQLGIYFAHRYMNWVTSFTLWVAS